MSVSDPLELKSMDLQALPRERWSSAIPSKVIDAYRSADYSFEVEAHTFIIHIGQLCPEIAEFIERFGGDGACSITAYNPLGEVVGEAENLEASEALRHVLETAAAPCFPAKGEDTDGSWVEPGYMVFSLNLQQARALGRRFRQNALVWIGRDCIPELVLLR